MQILDDNSRWQSEVESQVSMRFEGNRQQRKKHAKLRQRAGGSMRAQSVAIQQGAMEQQKAIRVMRRLKQHLGLLDELQIWGKGFKIRATKRAAAQSKHKGKKITAGRSRPLPSYRKPLVDKRGRIALFMAISYVGLKSAKWRPGLAADHMLYIGRDDAMETVAMTNGIVSSMGVSIGEIAQAWQALEEVEKAYRANAIVQHRLVVNLPHGLSAAGRERVLSKFCEKSFGKYGLPYVAIPHLPDPEGNSRNFHAHICISARPMSRTGDHEWMIGEEKISGFTDPDSLKRIRAEFAAVLNRECRREGLDLRYTHQNYRERGIDAKRQEHYGPERTAIYRKGEAVDMVERNRTMVERNETKATIALSNVAAQATTKLADYVRQRLALLERRKKLQRRMKVINGVLVLVNDLSGNNNSRVQNRSAIMKELEIKRPQYRAITVNLELIKIRQEAAKKLRKHFAAIRGSFRSVMSEVQSSTHTAPIRTQASIGMNVADRSNVTTDVKKSAQGVPLPMSVAVENPIGPNAETGADQITNVADAGGQAGGATAGENKDARGAVPHFPDKEIANAKSAPEESAAPRDNKSAPLIAETRGSQNQNDTDLPRVLAGEVTPAPQPEQNRSAMAEPYDMVENVPENAKVEISEVPDLANAANLAAAPGGTTMALPNQNSGATCRSDKDASPAKVAVAAPPDAHDLLIQRFETASTDAERRDAALSIRADKVALKRMVERKDARWIAVDNQFRVQQQRMAAMKGRGIGG